MWYNSYAPLNAELIRRSIEVVATRTTRNRFVGDEPARGFESLLLRQMSTVIFMDYGGLFYLLLKAFIKCCNDCGKSKLGGAPPRSVPTEWTMFARVVTRRRGAPAVSSDWMSRFAKGFHAHERCSGSRNLAGRPRCQFRLNEPLCHRFSRAGGVRDKPVTVCQAFFWKN